MKHRKVFASLSVVLLPLVLIVGRGWSKTQESAAGGTQVSGTVKDARGAALAGAMVHFAMPSRRTKTTVISRRDGSYTALLLPGDYQVKAELRGYESPPRDLTLRGEQRAQAELVLDKVQQPLEQEGQLNGSELLSALPEGSRLAIVQRCTGCHSTGVLGGQRLTQQGWSAIVRRMAGQHPTSKGNLGAWGPWERATWGGATEILAKLFSPNAKAIQGHNFAIANDVDHLSGVVIKEFELARKEIYTHDVAADPALDRVWYGDQAGDNLTKKGRFGWYDPVTGQSKEYVVPQCIGFSRLLTDRRGKVWAGCDDALAYWDPQTDQPVIYPLHDAEGMHGLAVDSKGIVWLPIPEKTAANSDDEYDYLGRFDPKTSQWNRYKIPTRLAGPYEAQVDSQDIVWFTEIVADKIGKFDPKTSKFTEYPIPTKRGAPRRFGIDSQDRIWFVEFVGNKVGMLDPRTGKFAEYPIPTPVSFPYACSVDRYDTVWFSEMNGNRIGRFDPQTKTFREYPIPSRLSGIKKLDFTYTKEKEIVWGGYRIGAKVVRFEIPRE